MADFKGMVNQVQALLNEQFTCSRFVEQDQGDRGYPSAPKGGTFIMVDSDGGAYRVAIEELR